MQDAMDSALLAFASLGCHERIVVRVRLRYWRACGSFWSVTEEGRTAALRAAVSSAAARTAGLDSLRGASIEHCLQGTRDVLGHLEEDDLRHAIRIVIGDAEEVPPLPRSQ